MSDNYTVKIELHIECFSEENTEITIFSDFMHFFEAGYVLSSFNFKLRYCNYTENLYDYFSYHLVCLCKFILFVTNTDNRPMLYLLTY